MTLRLTRDDPNNPATRRPVLLFEVECTAYNGNPDAVEFGGEVFLRVGDGTYHRAKVFHPSVQDIKVYKSR